MDLEDITKRPGKVLVYGTSILMAMLSVLGCEKEPPKPKNYENTYLQRQLDKPNFLQPISDYSQPIAEFNNNPRLLHDRTMVGGRIKIIRKNDEWIMVSEEIDVDSEATESHGGKFYRKIGISPRMRENQRNWLLGEEGAIGVIYCMEPDGLLRKITGISLETYGTYESAPFYELKINMDQKKETLFYREVVRNNKFAWYHEEEMRYFSAKERVPKGFRPLYTLRVRDYNGYDFTEPSPQFNDLSELRKFETTHVRFRGLQYHTSYENLESLILSPRSQLPTEAVKIVNFGDGSFKLYDKNSKIDAEVVQKVKGMKITIVEPLTIKSWNVRPEYLHPYSMF